MAHPLRYVTHLALAKEASSLHVTTNFVMNYHTSLDKPIPQKMYAANPSYDKAKEYQRWIYVRGLID